MIRTKTIFRTPHVMEEKSIRTFTGLTAPDFWNLCDKLINAGMRAGKSKLSLPSQVLLYLMKIRKGYDNDTLAILFGISKRGVYKAHWRGVLNHYIMGEGVPKMWSQVGLTDDQINAEFDKLKAKEDPMYTKLASFFEDPKKNSRIPMVSKRVALQSHSVKKLFVDLGFLYCFQVVLIDSTKLQVRFL